MLSKLACALRFRFVIDKDKTHLSCPANNLMCFYKMKRNTHIGVEGACFL